MGEPSTTLRIRARELLSDVAYGTTKEFFRVLVAASLTTILVAATRPEEQWSKGWIALVKIGGALAFLICVLFLAVERVIEYCDGGDQALALCSVLVPPPLPPASPPPPIAALTAASRHASRSAWGYVRRHPLQLVAAASSLFLADLLNLAIAIDKLDPVVRLVQLFSTPAGRVLAWLRRRVMQLRALSLAGIAARTV